MLLKWKYFSLPQKEKGKRSGLWLCAYIYLCVHILWIQGFTSSFFLRNFCFQCFIKFEYFQISLFLKQRHFVLYCCKEQNAIALCFRRPVVCWQKTFSSIFWYPKDFQGSPAWPGTVWMPSCQHYWISKDCCIPDCAA